MNYTRQVVIDLPFDEAVTATTEALGEEGFGVLCDIDVQATFAEKLDAEFDRYRILGACNPALAHEVLTDAPGVGTLLPCNVVVYETDDGSVVVRAVDPERLLAVVDEPGVAEVGAEVAERFDRVLAALDDHAVATER